MKTTVKTQGQARLFDNPILEFFTKSSALESSVTSISIAIICIYIGKKCYIETSITTILLAFCFGFVFWTLFEYLLHRYLFHISETAFRGSKRLQYLLHGVHHEYPNDAYRTLMPFLPKLLFAATFFILFHLVLKQYGAFFSAGFMIGYYAYSMMHYAIHRYKPPYLLRTLWHHHHVHHHLHDDKAFGVSSMFWDKIFRTMPPQYEAKEKQVRAV